MRMRRHHDIESIVFDACVAVAVLFFLFALFLPQFRSPSSGESLTTSNVTPEPQPKTPEATRATSAPSDTPAPAPAPEKSASAMSNVAKPASARAKAVMVRPAPVLPAPVKSAAGESAPAKPAPPQPAAEGAPPVKNYAVDAGIFREKSNAESLAKRIWNRHQAQAMITPIQLHGQTLYRVRLLVESQQKAQTLTTSLLQEENIQASVHPIE